jgi:outer membrane receptor protein involved in Fe transport
VLALPAGDLSVAVGAMYKRDEYFYTADPIGTVFLEDGNPDIQGFSASDDIEGSDHNTDLYIEALIPLLADRPGVERLEAGLGYRFSDYASAGGVDAYKAELLYQPVEPMRVRGSYQRAVRAPTVFELYLPQLPTNYFSEDFEEFGFLDPCTAGSPQRTGPDGAEVARLCLDQGVPAALLPTFTDRDDEHRGVAGGNPDLDPETADTLTFGTVLQSWSDNPWFSAMQLSVDWYRIEVDDAISTVYAYEYVPLCFDSRSNPGFDVDNELCGYFARDSVTGEIEDFGDIYRNIVGYTVSGIDTQFDWRFGAGPGEVGVNWLVSWLSEFETREYEGLPPEDRVGRTGRDIGGSLPEWKWNLNLRYDWGPATVALQWRYIDGMRDIDWDYEVPSYDYFDVFASYEFEAGPLAGLTLRGGVENLADEDPPLLPTQVQANTDPSQYDVLGRRYYVNLSYRF